MSTGIIVIDLNVRVRGNQTVTTNRDITSGHASIGQPITVLEFETGATGPGVVTAIEAPKYGGPGDWLIFIDVDWEAIRCTDDGS